MKKLRSVNTHFWDDPYIVDLDPIEKLLFLYFLTNPLTNLAGIYEIPPKRIAFDTGVDKEMVLKILSRFAKENKIHYIDGYIIMVNHRKNQKINPSIQKNIDETILLLPKSVREFFDSLYTACTQPVDSLLQDKDKDEVEVKYKDEDEGKDKSIINHHLHLIFDEFYRITNKHLSDHQKIKLSNELKNNDIPLQENFNCIISALDTFADYQDDNNRNTFKYFLGIIRGKRKDFLDFQYKKEKEKEKKEATLHRLRKQNELNNQAEHTKILSWNLFNLNKHLFDPELTELIKSLLTKEKYLEAQSKIYEHLEKLNKRSA